MSDIRFTSYDPSFKDRLIDFLGMGMSWAEIPKKERKKIFEWKYEKNPYIETPLCYLALDGETIVGHRGFVLQKFLLEENNHLFGTPGDSMIHPDYRRQGIFSEIVDFSTEDIIDKSIANLFLSLSTTRATTKATKKYGYVPVGERKKLYRFSIKKIFKNRYEGGIDLDTTLSTDRTGHTIEITNELKTDEIVHLMKTSTEDTRLKNARNEQFYRWRFDECPDQHLFLYFWSQGSLEGYISMEKDNFPFYGLDIDYYSILEYAYTGLYLFDEMIRTLTKKLHLPFIMSYTTTRKKEEVSILRKFGFKGSESYLINSLQKRGLLDEQGLPGLLVRPATKTVDESDFHLDDIDTRSEKNWSLFWSDVH